jgi:DNA-directed RNA polymerase subunit A"
MYGDLMATTKSDKIKPEWNITCYEPVGVIAAQSLGEPGTQMTMRSFHYAGMAEQVPTGLPRLIELVDARKTPKKPIMEVYLDKLCSTSQKKAKEVAQKIELVIMHQIANVTEKLDYKKIIILLRPKDVKYYNIAIELVRSKVREFMKGSKTHISSKENKITIVFDDKTKLEDIRKISLKLNKLHIKGVKGIEKAIVVQEDDNFKIFTCGSNIAGVREIKGVDPARIFSNDIKEIEKTLGIEAARNTLIDQLRYVMDSQGLYVDERHFMLLSDAMCFSGEIKSIGRHGLAGAKPSVFARAAFEETVRHLTEAAVTGTIDNLTGVTENILIGQILPIGTGRIMLKVKL